MKLKRMTAALLAAVTALSLFTGCKVRIGNKIAVIDKEEIMSRTDIENYRYPKQIELRIPVYDRGEPNQKPVTNNYWTQYVQKNFGDKHNIKVTYVSIPRKEEISRFNQLMAGSTAKRPDIIFNYDYPSIVSFADKGAFQELDVEMIKKYAPTFYEHTKHLDKYTEIDGKRYLLAAKRPVTYNWVTVIRKDWLDKCGLQVPTNDEEYLNMLRAFRDNKCGGEGTIPLAKHLANANYGNYKYRQFPLPEEENAMYSDITVCSLTWGPTKEQLKYDNMLYNEGLISPEWYIDIDGKKETEAFVSGKAGVYGMYLTKNPDVIADLKHNVPGAEVVYLPECPRADGVVTGDRKDNEFGMMTGITVSCEHPEAVLMYIEWLQKNLFTMQNGIEGVTYRMDGDIPILIDDYKGDKRMNFNGNKDMWCLVIEGKDLGSEELNVRAQEKMYAPSGYEFIIRESYETYKKKEQEGRLYTDFLFTTPITALTENGESLKNKWMQLQVSLVTCKPGEFEKMHNDACKEYLDAGYQKVLDEKKAAYANMQNK